MPARASTLNCGRDRQRARPPSGARRCAPASRRPGREAAEVETAERVGRDALHRAATSDPARRSRTTRVPALDRARARRGGWCADRRRRRRRSASRSACARHDRCAVAVPPSASVTVRPTMKRPGSANRCATAVPRRSCRRRSPGVRRTAAPGSTTGACAVKRTVSGAGPVRAEATMFGVGAPAEALAGSTSAARIRSRRTARLSASAGRGKWSIGSRRPVVPSRFRG